MKLTYITSGSSKTISSSDECVDIQTFEVDNHIKITVQAKAPIKLVEASINSFHKVSPKDKYFLNGFQSWTETLEANKRYKERNALNIPKPVLSRFVMEMYGDPTFYKHSKNKLHGYDVYYELGDNELFSYSLNYQNAFLVFEINKKSGQMNLISQVDGKELKEGEEFVLFDFKYYYSYQDGLNSFNESFPLEKKDKIFGYTSWYNYYQNIKEDIILRDLESLDNRFNLFQIDDGYETYVGDWLDVDQAKFPNGLKGVVDKVHSKGMKAGLWLAPFIAEKNSKLAKEHPDWIKGDKCVAGSWSMAYALDLDNEEVWAYIEKCLRHYMDLGFDFFKLDFLYAATAYIYEGKSRAEVAYKSYKRIRDISKDKIILGCGATILSSYKNFDYLRVGPDVSLKFDDVFYMKFMHRERISTKVTLQNTIYRSLFNNHLFGNDPDVFLLRDTNIDLSSKQKEALITINALFGNVLMTSDDISTYSEDKKEMLSKALGIYLHATNKSFVKDNDKIHISYRLNDEVYKLTYLTKKGIIVHE